MRAYKDDFYGNPVYSSASTDKLDTAAWPAAPTDLTATPVSDTEIDLAWTDNATDADRYNVQWRRGRQ